MSGPEGTRVKLRRIWKGGLGGAKPEKEIKIEGRGCFGQEKTIQESGLLKMR